ncbi:TPA: hypothetical protein DDW35_05295 [Candidatus Sumerlaeota bacterium]|nr:hypothetical protein [Candidatus Sumerlaeota bacterium]
MPQTIVYISPSSRLLGARRSLLQLVTNLDPERYRPVVVTNPTGDLVHALQNAGITTHPLQMYAWRKFRYWLQRPFKVRALASIFREENAALIHCNEFHSTPYAIRAARQAAPKPLPVLTHMRLSITPRQIRNYDLRSATRVLCVSHAAARDFHVWPDWKERVQVLYNGVDLEEFQPRGTHDGIRQQLGLPLDAFVIGQFGLVSPRKRAHLALQALAELKKTLPAPHNFRLLIVGSPGRSDHEYHAQLQQTVETEGLSDLVRFVPFTPDVVPYYQACDLNLLISNDEGFGRTIIEAGAMGVPTIGSRIGGIPELIEDGQTGFLIPSDESAAPLTAALHHFLEDNTLSQHLGSAAREHVLKNFTIASHVQKTMQLYDGILRAPML